MKKFVRSLLVDVIYLRCYGNVFFSLHLLLLRGGFGCRLTSTLQRRAANLGERLLGSDKFWGGSKFEERQSLGSDKCWGAANFGEQPILWNGEF